MATPHVPGRRRFLGAALATTLAACGRRKAESFPGYAFVANREGPAVAVVDLGVFATARHIRLDSGPARLLSHPTRPSVYALAPAAGTVYDINPDQLALAGRRACCRAAASMRLAPDGKTLWVLAREPKQLVALSTTTLQAVRRIPLPAVPVDFDLSPADRRAAVSFGRKGTLGLVDLEAGRLERTAPVGGFAGIVRYRGDGKLLLVADPARRLLNVADAASGALEVELPVVIRPEHFCFKPDGGELFVTGKGLDAVVTVHPYQTEIATTTLAGRTPGALAVSTDPNYLFVANPDSGDITILSIETQRVIAVVTVGKRPCHITVTPDNQYALVLNHDSGDMAVIRIATLTGRRRKFAPLFTMVPVGSAPVDAVVRRV